MLVPFRTALLPGALLAASLVATPVLGKDVYRASLDPAIPHHAAILDTLGKLEKSPGDAQLHNDLGCLVAWDGFWRDALRSFEEAADLAPDDGRPLFNAGLVEALGETVWVVPGSAEALKITTARDLEVAAGWLAAGVRP